MAKRHPRASEEPDLRVGDVLFCVKKSASLRKGNFYTLLAILPGHPMQVQVQCRNVPTDPPLTCAAFRFELDRGWREG